MIVIILVILWFVVFFTILYFVIKSAVANAMVEILHPPGEPRTCPACQEECAAGSRFCSHCGHAFSTNTPPEDQTACISCPNCKMSVPAEDLYCPQCGEKLP